MTAESSPAKRLTTIIANLLLDAYLKWESTQRGQGATTTTHHPISCHFKMKLQPKWAMHACNLCLNMMCYIITIILQ